MSNLNDIHVEFAEFTVTLDKKAKQQIKALILELIGEDEQTDVTCFYCDPEANGSNDLRAELRKKVEEL